MEQTNSSEQKALDVLVLAAGLGTRMRSDLAKVLHRIDGRPLVNHVCRTATALAPRKIYVVIGHQGKDVRAAVLEEIDEEHSEFVWQRQQLGTGDAVNAAREFLENEDSTLLVLSGDVPMIRAETLAALVQQHYNHRGRGAACTILSVKLDDPDRLRSHSARRGGLFRPHCRAKGRVAKSEKSTKSIRESMFQYAKTFRRSRQCS
jgi:bifunctional N-acetylglucosamine-1-phosphate-uridyltransferase/glucosamine-1-phosphate-acetyltransferase GlmU-like protein